MTSKQPQPDYTVPEIAADDSSLRGKEVTLTQLWEVGPRFVEGSPQSQALGLKFVAIAIGGATMAMPYNEKLIGDKNTGVIAGGAVTSLLDHAAGLAAITAFKTFTSVATLDLSIDYMRAAKPNETVIAQAHCYKTTRNVAFVRAVAHDGDPDDPVASAQIVFMTAADGFGPKQSETDSEDKDGAAS